MRAFLNRYIFNKLNSELRSIGSEQYFEKFPQKFVIDITKERKKVIVNMTLGEIFENKELYIYENEEGKFKFKQNLNVVQSEEIKKNEKFQKLLNKTFKELYKEYLNSDDFNIVEVNRIKKMGCCQYF